MESQGFAASCSSNVASLPRCPPSQVRSSRSSRAASTGAILHSGGRRTRWRSLVAITYDGWRSGVTEQNDKEELGSWRCPSVRGGGEFAKVELQQQSRVWTDRKLRQGRGDRMVANSVKEEEGEVEVKSAVGSSPNEQEEAAEKGGSSSSSFLTFLCPLLKLIGGGDPAAPRNAFLESATSGVASLARLPWGSKVDEEIAAERAKKGQPAQLFQLYEFEACPFCRRVREALTELDLSAEVYPCPKGSLRHREIVLKNGGKEQFPYFLDPNTGVSLYESSDIVNYLFTEYGGGRKPTKGLLESTLVTGWVPTIVRAGRGMMRYTKAAAEPPAKKLELYSYENNQFARLVRETLCELELPYVLRNAGKGSSSRDNLLKLAGSTQVPYLVDPNTGKSIAESLNIISYLFQTYGASA